MAKTFWQEAAVALNRQLYALLRERFGKVLIKNQGEAMDWRPGRDLQTGNAETVIDYWGEYYRVNCPFCHDRKQRLLINHRWGQEDLQGRPLRNVVVCLNETACMSDYTKRQMLEEIVTLAPTSLAKFRVQQGRAVAPEEREIRPPGLLQALHKLPGHHKARVYVEGRRFDPDFLGRHYGASYCSESMYTMARDRLIIPMVQRLASGTVRWLGWQARYLGELPWDVRPRRPDLPPKYFSCPGMRKSRLLYNFDVAKQYHTGVAVEGPTDVWRFGGPSMCTFGASMSPWQRRRLCTTFKDGALVLLYDPEAMVTPTVQKLLAKLCAALPGQVAGVVLPEGFDPGQLEQERMLRFVSDEARKQGVRVRWQKRKVG